MQMTTEIERPAKFIPLPRRVPLSLPPQVAGLGLSHLCDLIAQERTLAATNRLKPYQSQVMPRLQRLPPADLGALLDRLDAPCARYLLLESFQSPHPDRAATWLAHARPVTITRLLEALCNDKDGLRQARALLHHLPPEMAWPYPPHPPLRGGGLPLRHLRPTRAPRSLPRWQTVQECTLNTGLRRTRMEGQLRTEAGSFGKLRTEFWPLRVDLLAMDPARVRLTARRAIGESDLIPITEVLAQLGPRSRTDKCPPSALFDRLGLVRLSKAVAATGAIAGFNGGFYFDYGHYLDAYDLGLDLASVPGSAFGELAGWFVSGGVSGVPPVFNRAALLITADGRPHIRRVFAGRLRLAGRWRTWDAVNVRHSPEQVVFYNTVAGQRTPDDPTVVDVAIARGKVQAIRHGGGQPLPFWGAVLSIPQERARELLGGLHVGDPVTFETDLPAHLGSVVEAMACGPQLVRDGKVDLDFDLEHFGQKDTTVLPLSLTRAANFFRAARSFVMLRRGELVLGAVSGAALGTGRPAVSAGMTLGELARLVVSLGGEQAVALDGGGSSTLVALDEGAPRVLNVPTGGSDVPFGEERYINTYWLVFARG